MGRPLNPIPNTPSVSRAYVMCLFKLLTIYNLKKTRQESYVTHPCDNSSKVI